MPVLVTKEEVSHCSSKQYSNLPVSVVQLRTVDHQSPKSRREPPFTQLAVCVQIRLLFKTLLEFLDDGPIFTTPFDIGGRTLLVDMFGVALDQVQNLRGCVLAAVQATTFELSTLKDTVRE